MENTWKEILEFIHQRVSEPTFETWFKPCKTKREKGSWFIIAQNEFARDWLEMKYLSLMREAIYAVTSENPEIVYIVGGRGEAVPNSESKINAILSRINALNATEKEKLFYILKKNYSSVSQPSNEIQESKFDRKQNV